MKMANTSQRPLFSTAHHLPSSAPFTRRTIFQRHHLAPPTQPSALLPSPPPHSSHASRASHLARSFATPTDQAPDRQPSIAGLDASVPLLSALFSGGFLYAAAGTAALGLLGAAALAAAALCAATLPLLKHLNAQHVVRTHVPPAHEAKSGTPTMGGLAVVAAAIGSAALMSGWGPNMTVLATAAGGMGLVGLIDDLLILKHGKVDNARGLSPGLKLVLQAAVAAATCVLTAQLAPFPPYDALPLFDVWALYLGDLYWILAGTTLVSECNGMNLTDGLDGLAAGTAAVAFAAFAVAVSRATPTLVPLCAAFSGACLGFLALNRRPADIFMGNVGSLAIGGALGALIILSKFFIPGLLVSGVFALETLSVLIQVWFFKATKGPDGKGKRFFLMAPIHHHFELKGVPESRIAACLVVLGAVFGVLGAAQGLSAPIVI